MDERDSSGEKLNIFNIGETHTVDVEHILAANKLIEQTVEIIPVLNTEREPEVAKYEFMFYGDRLHDLVLPQHIADSLITREVTSVSILTSSSIYDPLSPTLSMDIYTREGNDERILSIEQDTELQQPTASLSINPESGESATGLFYADTTKKETSIAIPQTYLRQSIASLIFPIYDGDYQDFAELNLLDPEVFSALNNALRKHANESTTEARYEFKNDTELDGWIYYTLDDAKLTSAELYDIRKRQQGVSRKQELIDEEAGIQVQLLFDENSLGIAFYESKGPVGAETRPTPFSPDIQDMIDMHEFVATKNNRIKSNQLQQVIPLQEHHATSTDSHLD